jgi:hypothetical protein
VEGAGMVGDDDVMRGEVEREGERVDEKEVMN